MRGKIHKSLKEPGNPERLERKKKKKKKRFSEKGGVVEERQGYKKTPYVSDLYTT